ncbi:DNA damage response [Lecanosticta acicola]|uniref:DNA damage response n=1 Tax=Lecanosticta acicola TaxID=111012 RepID=A0AAI8Z1A3_9PEZI|nr:DNA damage response [Lecanosticta acicola]
MWILSCDQPFLGGKRIWLRPGTSHLLGRNSNRATLDGLQLHFIDYKAVSRQHLQVKVHDVEEGDSGKVFKKSGVTVVEGSKSGTNINGEVVKAEEKVLDVRNTTAFEIRLGSLDAVFKLEWKPIVLSLIGKKGTVRSEKERLVGSDVKLVTEYLMQNTTHVVSKKRNTIQGLQALLQGRWIVTDSWVGRLVEAAKPRESGEKVSLLEEDFDKYWPKEEDYLVPTAGEPTPRPNEYLKPDSERADIFAGFTFIFLSESQHDQFLPVVTAGGGKATLFPYELGRTKPQEVDDFARGLVRKKNNGLYPISQEPGPGGIVVIRLTDHGAGSDLESICVAIGQRIVAQNEFLDAILMKDTSNFRTPLKQATQNQEMSDAPPDSSRAPRLPADSSVRPPRDGEIVTIPDSPPESQRPTRSAPQPQQEEPAPGQEPEENPTYKARRTITRSRFQGFDDFDPSQIAKADSSDSESDEEPKRSVQPSQAAGSMEVDEPSQPHNNTDKKSTRKRPAVEELADEDAELPGQAALKRRRTEALKKGHKSFMRPSPEPDRSSKEDSAKDKKGKVKTGKSRVKTESEDIKKLRAKREEEDEQRRLDEEALQRAGDEPVERLDPVVETFDVQIRSPGQRQESQQNFHNPSWNGRKNFKRFRSNKKRADGTPGAPRPRDLDSQRSYISLEEIPGKSHGMGDDYWLEEGADRARKKGRHVQTEDSQRNNLRAEVSQHRQSGHAISLQNGTQVLSDAEEEDDTQAFRRRIRVSREEDREDELAEKAFEEVERGSGFPSSASQTLRSDNGVRKRPAAQAKLDTGMGPPAKKSRAAATSAAAKRRAQTLGMSDDDDEAESQMAFRRKRR